MKKVDATPQHIKATNRYGIEQYLFPYTTENEVLVEEQSMTLKERLAEINESLTRLEALSKNKTGIVFQDTDGDLFELSTMTFVEKE